MLFLITHNMTKTVTKGKGKNQAKSKADSDKGKNKKIDSNTDALSGTHDHHEKQGTASGHHTNAEEAQKLHEETRYREGYEEHGASYDTIAVEKDVHERYREHSENQAKQKGKSREDWNYESEHDITDNIRADHEKSMAGRGVKEGELETKLKRMEVSPSNREEYDRLIAKYKEYLKKNGIKGPSYSERLETFVRTLLLMAKNSVDITIGKYAVNCHNNETVEGLKKGDHVIIYLHGMWQDGGSFGTAIAQAEREGYKALAFSYNFNDSHEKATASLEPLIMEVYKKTGVKPTVVGHSMGANTIEYGLKEKNWGAFVGEAVLSQGATMGISYTTPQQKLVLSILKPAKTANMKTEEGRAIALNFAYKPFSVPTHIITGTGDMLIGNPAYSISPYATSFTAVKKASHFSGAGGDPIYNKIVLNRLARGSNAGEGGEIMNIPVYERIIPRKVA